MSRPTFDLAEHDVASNKRFAELMNELDQAKLDILALKEQSLKQQALAHHIKAPQQKHHGDLTEIHHEIQKEKKRDSTAVAQTRAARLAQAKKQYLLAPPPDFYSIVEIKERLTLENG